MECEKKRTGTSARRPLTVRHRILVAVLSVAVPLVLLVIAALVTHYWNAAHFPQTESAGMGEDESEGIVFYCFGDSVTLGQGAPPDGSYPMRLLKYFRKSYPDVPVKVRNFGRAGMNSATGLYMIESYFKKHPEARPDFALVMFGKNNHWNLRGAPIWNWDETLGHPRLMPFMAEKAAKTSLAGMSLEKQRVLMRRFFDYPDLGYKKFLDRYGWRAYFDGFDDPIVSRWITQDLSMIAKKLRSMKVEPIFLTYHFSIFETINDLIRNAAKQNNAVLIDVEMSKRYYLTRMMCDADMFHLNAIGYDDAAERIVGQFRERFGPEKIAERLQAKSRRERNPHPRRRP